MSEELTELQEHAEHAKHDPSLAPVSLTMAVLAVLVAVVTLLGHRAHTEEVVLQAKSSDQWAYYQAKNIRRHEDELFVDLTSAQATTDAVAMGKLRDKYSGEAARYKDEQKAIEDKAHEMEADVSHERNRADHFHHSALGPQNLLASGRDSRGLRNRGGDFGVFRALNQSPIGENGAKRSGLSSRKLQPALPYFRSA
jgi:hypothetical protein